MPEKIRRQLSAGVAQAPCQNKEEEEEEEAVLFVV